MPKIRTSRTKAPPEGFEEIESILEDYARAMRNAENENTEGKRAKGKHESISLIMTCLMLRFVSHRGTLAHHEDRTYEVTIYLRPVLQTRSDK